MLTHCGKTRPGTLGSGARRLALCCAVGPPTPAPPADATEAEPRGGNGPGRGLRPALAVCPLTFGKALCLLSPRYRNCETGSPIGFVAWPMRSGDQGPRGTAPAPRSCFSFRGSQQPRPCPEASARAVPCPQDAAPRVPAPTPAGPSSAAAASVRAFPARPSIPGGGCPSRQGRAARPCLAVA